MSWSRRFLLLAVLCISILNCAAVAVFFRQDDRSTAAAQHYGGTRQLSSLARPRETNNSQTGSLHSKTSEEAPTAVRTRSRDPTLTRHSPSTEPAPNVLCCGASTSEATVTHPELVTGRPMPDATAYDRAAQHTKGNMSDTVRNPPELQGQPYHPRQPYCRVSPGKLGKVNEGGRCCKEVAEIALEDVCHGYTELEDGHMPAETADINSNCSCLDFLLIL